MVLPVLLMLLVTIRNILARNILILWLIGLFALCAAGLYARADEAEKVQLINLKIVPSSQTAQLVATFNTRPQYRLMLLDAPVRLVIDLPQTVLGLSLEPAKSVRVETNQLVRQLSYGGDGIGGVRLVVEGHAPFKIADWHIEPLHDAIWQMVVELEPANQQDFAEQAGLVRQNFASQNGNSGHGLGVKTISERQDALPASSSPRRFTIVLDAGHGGFDSGAEGGSGLLEKDVTLTFAHDLREVILQQNPDFSVALTREEDIFLRLSERVAIARKLHADLFISIHADSIHLGHVRGATVYTISDKASDALAKALAENENRVDLLDGLPADEPLSVTDILLDLTRRETDALSIRFADELIEQLSRAGVRLIRPSHRYGGFMVLRAPEIPSVLVELGYLSNRQDEKLIMDPEWRGLVAASMAKAIAQYAINRGGG